MAGRCRGGSDPSAPHFPRRLKPRWSLPPRHTDNQTISGADTERICAGYKPDQLCISC